MLRQRIVTAAVLGIVFIGSIVYDSPGWLALLFSLVLLLAVRELVALSLPARPILAVAIAALFSLLFWFSLDLVTQSLIYWQALLGLAAWLVIALLLPLYRQRGDWPLLWRMILLGIGLDLLWICVHGLVYLQRQFEAGEWILLYLLTLIWVADIGAYFSGRRFGRRKLATISPGKTWEGVAGAIIAVLIWMLVVHRLTGGWGIGLPLFMGIGLVTVLLSIVGDLSVSILKREAGVKDSGKLLPGHGGVLDRIDSLIAASPVFVSGLFAAGLS